MGNSRKGGWVGSQCFKKGTPPKLMSFSCASMISCALGELSGWLSGMGEGITDTVNVVW